MKFQDKLGRLLQTGAIEGEGGGKAAQPPPRRWRRVLALLLGLVAAAVGDAALAAVRDDVEGMSARPDDPSIHWHPPDSERIVVDEAQWGSPVAPFVFDGGVLHVGASFESVREFRIRKRAVIDTREGAALRLGGRITSDARSGQGLAKLGAGTLRLTGVNDYRGSTLLLQGGLDVGGSQALGQVYNTLHVNTGTRLRYAPGISVGNGLQLQPLTIASHVPAGSYTDIVPPAYADSVQWIIDHGEAVQVGAINGWAPIVKKGAGRLRLSGSAMAYDGLFTVDQGALAVDGIFSGPMQVNGGARLEGEGAVGETVVEPGGVLMPGNGLNGPPAGGPGNGPEGRGTGLAVRGDLTFRPGSRFDVRVAPSGENTSVRVSGKAFLDGDVMALAQAGDWQASTRYTLLHADGGFDGTRFASVATDLAFLSPSLEYDASQVYLVMRRNDTDFGDVADDGDEDVADAVDDPGGAPDIRDEIVEMTEPQARDAFRQLSGDWTGSVRSSIIDDSRFLREAVWANANPFAPWGAAGARGAGGARAWGYGFYSRANRRPSGNVGGDARDIGGAVLGITHPVRRDVEAGVFFGMQNSRMKRDASMADADIDSIHLGASLAGRWHGALWTLGAAYTRHTVASTRTVAAGRLHDSLSGRYHAGGTQLFGQVSWPFAAPALTPFVRLAGLHVHVQGFTENGGPAALEVLPAGQSIAYSTLGLKAVHRIEAPRGNALITASLAWRHAFGDVLARTSQRFRDSEAGRVFDSEGLPLARNAWQLELGLRARLARNLKLSLAYAGQFASGLRDHGARLDLAWSF